MTRAEADHDDALRRASAPIYRDALRLAEWILRVLGPRTDELARSLCRLALALSDALALALGGRDVDRQLEDADELLVRARGQLRLAATMDLIDSRRLVHALGLCDSIGRQLGGWLRRRELV